MASCHGADEGTRGGVDVAEKQRRRLVGPYAWLIAGMFSAALGMAVTAPSVAHADSGTQTSSDRGTHSGRGGAGSATDSPGKASSRNSGASATGASPAATVPTRVSTRTVVTPKSTQASVPAVTPPAAPVTPAPTAPAATAPAPTTPAATTSTPAQAPNPAKPSLAEFLKNLSITPSTATTPVAPAPVKAATPKTFNLGLGNVGKFNFGAGNKGDWNFGSGNLGSGNVGSGNLGSKNFGIGNTGDGNFGGGNTGSGNIGFGNTGTGNIGIGLTGDHQFGFGGFNSGTGNKGWFNSGSGNTGWFNSGSGNSGLGNAGDTNTGRFNVGDVNSGNANVGDLNNRSFNVGSSNSGSFNPGSTNTGWLNSGDLNTGWFNSGNSNTGVGNSGYLNTGWFNSGNASNGFFETQDNQNWFPGIHLEYTVPGITIDETVPVDINKQIALGPLTLTVGPTTADVHVTGSTGPIQITILDIPAGPGFFNTGTVASSGFFNTGAGGGSGLLNTGVGLASGWFNQALQVGSGLSGYSSSGSGSGFSNLGSAVSGAHNTSSLDPSVSAFISGSGNVGALMSGTYYNKETGKTTFNLGSGNTGSLNVGNGNLGDHNLGSGNEGDGNLGVGNIGDGNLGSGNNGNGNFGAGNTGSGNIGFGNTGTGNIGIGLTGDHQFGFGGFNSGTGNKGLFNSGTGNKGIFNSGANNWGMGNSGTLSTGFFNSGDVNSGNGNVGDFNTGSKNVGSFNTGTGNGGDTNSGVANVGDRNTGWANVGGANTGWVNTGNLNTGGYNTGDGNNGLFWRRNGGGQLNIDLGADISEVPITLNADIPVNIPITAVVTDPISIPGFELPAVPIDTTISTTIELAPGLNADVVLDTTGSVGPITFPGTDITVPQIVGTIGGPGVSIPITVNGSIGPGRISVLQLGGPGLFNSSIAPSSGLFNSGGGGGSGFFNSGAGVASGLFNEALQAAGAGQSGVSNSGSGSGSSNVGSAVSGWSNTSSLAPLVPAYISGLRNVGSMISGLFVNDGTGATAPVHGTKGGQLTINLNADVSAIPINLDGEIGVNVPINASATGPITISGFTIPTIPGNLLGTLSISVPTLGIGPAVIPLTPDLGIGPISVPDINVVATDPLLSGLIGGPDVTIPINISGAIGPSSASPGAGQPLFEFKRTDTPGFGADLNITVPHTPITLNADVPVDVPFNADFGAVTLQGFTIPGFNIATSNWTNLRNEPVNVPVGSAYLDFNVPSTDLPVSDISLDSVTVQLPSLSGRIGGPGAGIGLNLDAGVGPFTVGVPIGVSMDSGTPSISVDQVLVSQIPFTADVAVPVDLPVSLSATPLTISQIVLPQITLGTLPSGGLLQGLVFQGAVKNQVTPPRATVVLGLTSACTTACIALQLSPYVSVGPVAIGPIEIGFPNDQALSLNIGGPGKGVAVNTTGALGPIVISLANQVIQEFPYSYSGSAGIDIPIDGSTGDLDLQQVDLSVPVQALLYQRVGYCLALGATCSGMTASQFVAYINGGTPAGSAPGPFPPAIPVDSSVLIDENLGQPIGPLTLLPSIPISQGITDDTTFSGSGTLGPFPISF
jgi:PPE-repeat protein